MKNVIPKQLRMALKVSFALFAGIAVFSYISLKVLEKPILAAPPQVIPEPAYFSPESATLNQVCTGLPDPARIVRQPVSGLWENSAASKTKSAGSEPVRIEALPNIPPITQKNNSVIAEAPIESADTVETEQPSLYATEIPTESEETKEIQDPVIRQEQLNQYAVLVRSLVNSRKEYPSPARQQKQQGMVQVCFVLSCDGQFAKEPILEKECPYEKLNVAALDAVKNAAPYPPFPDGVEEKELGFSIIITFSLR